VARGQPRREACSEEKAEAARWPHPACLLQRAASVGGGGGSVRGLAPYIRVDTKLGAGPQRGTEAAAPGGMQRRKGGGSEVVAVGISPDAGCEWGGVAL